MLNMSGAYARQDSNSKVIETTFQSAFIMETFEKKNTLRILHVDDDLCFLEVSKQILSMENNFEIDNVESVDDAFKKMEHQTYDAVVSDYEMPQKNGLDFLQKLRDKNNQIPFILFTGKGREDVAVKALNLGVDCYLNKNGSPETIYCELADAINKTVERKKSRELLAKSESKYHALVENSLQGISILLTAPIRIVFANGAFGKILGYSSQELTSLSPSGIMGLVYHEDRAVFFKRMEDRLRGETAGTCFEFRAVRKDGSIIWLSSLANRVDYDGQPAVQGMFLDVNESKNVSEILRESEERYRELANCLPDIVFESDTTGKLVFVNERALEIAGISHQDFEKGLNILQFLVPEDRERAMTRIQRLLAGGSYVPDEYVFLRKDGTTFPALITTTLRVSQNKVTGLRGLVIDITERKKDEEVVRKNEQRYRDLVNSLPETVLEADLTGKITFLSQRAFDITGFSREELEKGLNMLSFVVPKERERAIENIKKSMVGEAHGANEYTLLRKNGTTFPALVRTNPIISENKVTGLRGLIIDITERKKAEDALTRSMDKLVLVNEKLNVVGSLTRHDVRNKLLAVTGNAFLLKKKHPDQPDIIDGLGKIGQACTEIGAILDFAKMYEQLGVEALTNIDVEKTLNEAQALISGSLKVKVINDCHGLTLLADSFLRQLFFNLMDNSVKHGKKVTTIKATYEKVHQDRLNLIYEDDGIGISVQNKLKLFKEGYSTGGSSGYGLYLIRKMIEVYGWTIQENGEPDKGAKFTITIPKINQKGKGNFQIA